MSQSHRLAVAAAFSPLAPWTQRTPSGAVRGSEGEYVRMLGVHVGVLTVVIVVVVIGAVYLFALLEQSRRKK
jgi:hypothetical protein